MRKFIFALFSIIVLLGLSSAHRVGRETNANRLARGLPPNSPTRRSTAKRQVPIANYNVYLKDMDGKQVGWLGKSIKPNTLDVFVGNFATFWATYDNNTRTLSSLISGNYVGGHNGSLSSSPILQEVTGGISDNTVAIWTLNNIANNNQLLATWVDPSGSTTPVHFSYDSGRSTIKFTGDTSLKSTEEVLLYLVG